MDGVADGEPDVAVDAGAAVPAAVGLSGVIDADGEDVGLAEDEFAGEVDVEAGVAVGVGGDLLAVEVESGALVDAFKFEGEVAMGEVCAGEEGVAVPGDAGGEEAAVAAHGVFGVGVAFDAPVVGEGDGAPGGVVELGILGIGEVAEVEFPVVVDADAGAGGQRGVGE